MNEIKALSCKKCGRRWDYKGVNDYFATCPTCLRKVSVQSRRDLEQTNP